jgi:hypothetical protein
LKQQPDSNAKRWQVVETLAALETGTLPWQRSHDSKGNPWPLGRRYWHRLRQQTTAVQVKSRNGGCVAWPEIANFLAAAIMGQPFTYRLLYVAGDCRVGHKGRHLYTLRHLTRETELIHLALGGNATTLTIMDKPMESTMRRFPAMSAQTEWVLLEMCDGFGEHYKEPDKDVFEAYIETCNRLKIKQPKHSQCTTFSREIHKQKHIFGKDRYSSARYNTGLRLKR